MSDKKNVEHNHDSHHHHHHDHSLLPEEPELRVKAIETLLLNKGIINSDTVSELIDTYENKIGPRNGAKVVARLGLIQSIKKGF